MEKVSVEEIINVINELKNITVSSEQIEENLSDLGMDSISFIQMVVRLEEVFSCDIPDSNLFVAKMDTVKKIKDVLESVIDS